MTPVQPLFVAAARPSGRGLHRAAALIAVVIGLLGVPAFGQSLTWLGTSGTNWSTAANWNPATSLVTGSTYALTFGGSNSLSNFNDIGPGTLTLNGLLFSNTQGVGVSLFKLYGNPLSLSSATITTANSTNTQVSGGDEIYTPITLNGPNTISLGLGHSLSIIGNIDGTGSLSISGGGNTQGLGAVYVSGSNTYSGNTTITGGFVVTSTSGVIGQTTSPFGSGTVSVSNATILLRNGSSMSNTLLLSGFGASGAGDAFTGSFGTTGTVAVVNGPVTLSGNASIGTAGSTGATGNELRINGSIDLGANTLTLRPDRNTSVKNLLVINGTITGGGGVTLTSPVATGEVRLNAANTYSGVTQVNLGILSGTGSVAGLLSIGGTGARFDPGAGANSGVTTIFGVGSYAQATGGTTVLQINGLTAGTNYDQVLFSGTSKTVSWGGGLDLSLSGSSGYASYTQFNLFQGFSSQSGNLTNVVLNAAGTPYNGLVFTGPVGGVWKTGTSVNSGDQYLEFDQNTGILTVVPEPTALGIAAAGILILGLTRTARGLRYRKVD